MVYPLVAVSSVLVTTAVWRTSLSPGLCQIVAVPMHGAVRRGSFLMECAVWISLGGMGYLFGAQGIILSAPSGIDNIFMLTPLNI